jgi:hypothetical protein
VERIVRSPFRMIYDTIKHNVHRPFMFSFLGKFYNRFDAKVERTTKKKIKRNVEPLMIEEDGICFLL